MEYNISGIQQVGIGIPNVHEAWKWYRQNFGMDIPVFEEAATANLMLPYTGGQPHDRHAVLAINENGGGGMEIWQYTSREPQLPNFDIQLGDLGLYACKIKSRDVFKTYDYLKSRDVKTLSYIQKNPIGQPHFFVEDPYGNIFEIVEGRGWFGENNYTTGGPYGCVIGVTDMTKSMAFYSKVLGYDKIIYNQEGVFKDLEKLPAGEGSFHRVLLTHSKRRKGPFSSMLGPSEIELVVAQNRSTKKIFENRFWGDRGFIHLCFDVTGMDNLKSVCESEGHPFTVDSAEAEAHKETFDMGEAAGRFSYVEDPDGTLIEFVETHKLPIMKKWNWYLNLKKRNPKKSLPTWMLKTLALNKVKD